MPAFVVNNNSLYELVLSNRVVPKVAHAIHVVLITCFSTVHMFTPEGSTVCRLD